MRPCARSRALRRALLVLSAAALAACDPGRAARPRRPRPAWSAGIDAGAAPRAPDGGFRPPPEADPRVTQGEPVDLGVTQCPHLRLARVDRRLVAPAPGAAPPRPRYYGRDEHGRFVPLHDVLACELREMHFVTNPINEGVALVLLRGPDIFEPDSDCDWREPVRRERTAHGLRLYVRERCRRRAVPAPAERTVVVDVSEDHTRITAR